MDRRFEEGAIGFTAFDNRMNRVGQLCGEGDGGVHVMTKAMFRGVTLELSWKLLVRCTFKRAHHFSKQRVHLDMQRDLATRSL